jgi:hypothetical protein
MCIARRFWGASCLSARLFLEFVCKTWEGTASGRVCLDVVNLRVRVMAFYEYILSPLHLPGIDSPTPNSLLSSFVPWLIVVSYYSLSSPGSMLCLVPSDAYRGFHHISTAVRCTRNLVLVCFCVNSDLDGTLRQNQCPDSRRVLHRTVLGLLGLVLIDVSWSVRATGT